MKIFRSRNLDDGSILVQTNERLFCINKDKIEEGNPENEITTEILDKDLKEKIFSAYKVYDENSVRNKTIENILLSEGFHLLPLNSVWCREYENDKNFYAQIHTHNLGLDGITDVFALGTHEKLNDGSINCLTRDIFMDSHSNYCTFKGMVSGDGNNKITKEVIEELIKRIVNG